jgi:4a-hydroxytetrahydrobiopterin dehydratase
MAKLSKEQIEFNISKVPGWTLKGNSIERVFVLEGFKEAVTFVNQIAEYAEDLNHHPDIRLQFNQVTVTLTTHEYMGLSGKDFALAQRINKLIPPRGKAM